MDDSGGHGDGNSGHARDDSHSSTGTCAAELSGHCDSHGLGLGSESEGEVLSMEIGATAAEFIDVTLVQEFPLFKDDVAVVQVELLPSVVEYSTQLTLELQPDQLDEPPSSENSQRRIEVGRNHWEQLQADSLEGQDHKTSFEAEGPEDCRPLMNNATAEADTAVQENSVVEPEDCQQEEACKPQSASEVLVKHSSKRDFFLPTTVRRAKRKAAEGAVKTMKQAYAVPVSTRVTRSSKRCAEQQAGSTAEASKPPKKNGLSEVVSKPPKKNGLSEDVSKPPKKNAVPEQAEPRCTEDSALSEFNLWNDAKLAAEENARLSAGKPLHPFFLKHNPVRQARAENCSRSVLLEPSLPFHITQTVEHSKERLNWNRFELQFLCSAAKSYDSLDQQPKPEDGPFCLSFTAHDCLTTTQPDLGELAEYVKAFSVPENVDTSKSRYHRYTTRTIVSSQRESCDSNLLWTDRYKPRSSNQVCGNKISVGVLNDWLQSWKLKITAEKNEVQGKFLERDPDYGWFEGEELDEELQNVMLITGPIGCGKSAAIYACANEQGYEVIEINASDTRNGAFIKHKFGEAFESHAVTWSSCDAENNGTRKGMTLILFEEIDHLFSEDKGFMAALVQFAKTSKRPIVLTSNRRKPNLQQLEPCVVDFAHPSVQDLVVHASMVCASSGISGYPWLIEHLVRSCQQDMRKLMMLLQFWGQGLCPCASNIKMETVSRGCLLKDSVQLCASVRPATDTENKVAEAVTGYSSRWAPQASWWFDSEVHFRLLPQLLPLRFQCDFAKYIAEEISVAVQEADEAAFASSIQSAERIFATRKRKRKGSDKSNTRKLKRLRKQNHVDDEPPSTNSSEAKATECMTAVKEPVQDRWRELRSSVEPLAVCGSKCCHETASRISSAFADFEDICSACDVISASCVSECMLSDDLGRLDIAAQLAIASFGHLAGVCRSEATDCMFTGNQTDCIQKQASSWHEQDLLRQRRGRHLKEVLFSEQPRLARVGMNQAAFCDYVSCMAQIAKLDGRPIVGRPSRRSQASGQQHYLTETVRISEEAFHALQEFGEYKTDELRN